MIIGIFLFLLLLPQVSEAYINPGAGAYLFSLIASFVATALHFYYRYFRSLKKKRINLLNGKNYLSKARQLDAIKNRVHNVVVLDQVLIEQYLWPKEKVEYINKIKQLNVRSVIVRSSLQGEDHGGMSLAGSYESIVVEDSQNENAIVDAINKIFKAASLHPYNEVFVQEHIDGAQECGVVITRDHYSSAYMSISLVTNPSSTDLVTSGSNNEEQTFFIFRNNENHRFQSLIHLASRLESLLGESSIDFEYLIKGDKLYLLQARPMKLNKQTQIYGPLLDKNHLEKISIELDQELKSSKALSHMSDWNPVEILGVNPGRLSNSLFQKIIADDIWTKARQELNYSKPYESKLCCEVNGNLYVRIRGSIESLMPDKIDESIKQKILNHQTKHLLATGNDDRVEFENHFSYWPLDKSDLLSELKNLGFSEQEQNQFQSSIKDLTLNLIRDLISGKDLERATALFLTPGQGEELVKILEELGFLFSKVARCAFVARSYLDDTESQDEVEEILKMVSQEAHNNLHKILIENNITSIPTRERSFSINSHREMVTVGLGNKSVESEKRKITKLFERSDWQEFGLDAVSFDQFILSSLSEREVIKRLLLLKIDEYFLDLKRRVGSQLSDEEMSLFSMKEINKIENGEFKNLQKEIILRSHQAQINKEIRLPGFISSGGQVYEYEDQVKSGNFIGQSIVIGETYLFDTELENPSTKDYTGKVMLIERGEPGLDWIFDNPPKAIISCYGGPNSHLAIRCYETSIPAVLGVGETLFNKLRTQPKIKIDGYRKIIEHN